jgi:uncharacterized Zn finger protein
VTAERVPTLTIPMPSREHPRAKAARLLLEGRLTLLSAHAGRVTARVRGDQQSYHLGFTRGHWWCHCPETKGRCSHLLALASVIDVAQWEGGTPDGA